MDGFDLLGAEPVKSSRPSWPRTAIALAAGAIAAALNPRHPVLTFLGTSALASNAHAVATGERTWKSAAKRMGRHVVATAGSLALPAFPAIGYVAGAIAGDLLLDSEGNGIIDEWARYEDVSDVPKPDVIDAEFTETKNDALVKG